MLRWKKVPCTVRWKIHYIDLHVEVPSEFTFSWQRGDLSGQSDPRLPNPNHHLIFDASYECPCKLYVDKKTGQVRSKKIKMTLTRRLSAHQTKLYGSLALEVGQYFGVKNILTVVHDMESGQNQAPTLHVSIGVCKVGEEMSATAADQNDRSFLDETIPHVPLSSWDVPTPASDPADGAERPKHRKARTDEDLDDVPGKHRRARAPPPLAELVSPIASPAPIAEIAPEAPAEITLERNPRGGARRGRIPPQIAPEDSPEITPEVTPESPPDGGTEDDGIVRRKRRQGGSVRKAMSTQLDGFLGLVQVGAPSPDRYSDEMSNIDFFKWVIAHNWTTSQKAPLFLPGLDFPTIIFPLFGGVLKRRILDAHGPNFKPVFQVIIEELRLLNMGPREKFFMLAAFAMLIRENPQPTKFDSERVKALLQPLQELLDQQILKVLQAPMAQTDVLVNRFATAAFAFFNLLKDFRDVVQGIRRSFKYGDVVNAYLLNQFVVLFERKLLNKVIENPARFNFRNAMLWNSLVTAFENDERVPLPLLREGISGLVMASKISTEPEIASEVCPNIPPIICAFYCQNFHPDDLMA
jgi:hypothetical protein